jgi:hypothetical protein
MLMKTTILMSGLVAALLAVQAAHGASQDTWQKFTSPDGDFTVQLPGKPLVQTKKVPSPFGDMEMKLYLRPDEDGVMYGVVSCQMPKAVVRQGKGDEILDGLVAGFVLGADGQDLTQEKTTLGKYPGRAFRAKVSDGDGSVRGRAYLVKQRAYIIVYMAPKASDSAQSAQEFFDSFALDEDK